MKTILVMAFGAVAILSSVVLAQSRTGQQSSNEARQTMVAPYTQPAPVIPPFRRFLFSIGNLPVGVWAPVQPPYDSRANRNNAANPLWWDDAGAY